jgi:tetratricopeptide (TPR) repeat protein
MPSSDVKGKSQIADFVRSRKHDKMLDIGCGEGTYAMLLPEAEWTGVEVWQPYVDGFKLHELYQNLHVMDARQWEPGSQRWDIAVAGDVLEHMTEREASDLLLKLRSCADLVIISIPFNMAQGEWGGNPYERHVKDDWTHEEVKSVFGEPEWCHIDYPIGVYAYKGLTKERLKICVYAISKNEAHFVQRFCESAKDADLILIADTGSTDGLPDEARKHGAVVHDICITPWRFDLARNAALALVPRDIDVCISLDIDELLQPGWREEIERVWMKGYTTRLRYMFDWGCGIQFYYEKIHAKHGYMWHHPCHEYPISDGRIKEVWAQTDMLLAVHKPDPTKSRGQYVDLLELSVKEDPDCPRNAFYYARELSFHSKWAESIEACKTYLQLPLATWENERCYAYRVMGRSYAELGQPWEAEKAFHQAAGEAPNTREPWCELAMLMYRQCRWEECFAYAMRALKIENRAMVYTCDPVVWGAQPHDLASIAAWHLGMKEISLAQSKIALEKEPDDLRLQTNLKYIQGQMHPPEQEAA